VRRSLLCLAAFHGSVAVARCLLGLGANPLLASPDDGYTALHAAAEAGHENTIKLLLEHGADHEAVDCRGLRPLELQLLAAQRKHKEKLEQQQEQQRRAQAQHEPCQLSQEFLLSLRMRDMTTVVTDPSYDDFEVAVVRVDQCILYFALSNRVLHPSPCSAGSLLFSCFFYHQYSPSRRRHSQ